jgi:mRNA-degrading endonuclease RelE of RelBE toxin-antitoxin system
MSDKTSGKHWYLTQGGRFEDQFNRIPAKYRSQITRKVQDLMNNPRPGGPRTVLTGYDDVCRLKCGAYRVIYTYNDSVVQLLAVGQRNEETYDHLDELERTELAPFRAIKGKAGNGKTTPNWEELAKNWGKVRVEKPARPTYLSEPITTAMLKGLGVPETYWATLTALETCEQLIECEDVPYEYRNLVVDRVWPCGEITVAEMPSPVTTLDDLADPAAVGATGPIDAADPEPRETIEEAMPASDGGKSGLPSLFPRTFQVVSTRRREPMQPYGGNTSHGIAKDTRYTAKLDGSVQLVYYVGRNERALLTTDAHSELVEMVNEAKRVGGGTAGGGFVINEYRHVLVPTLSAGTLYAGRYTRDLEFEFEGTLISPVAPPDIGPGDVWPGPHVGMKYKLTARAADISYDELTSRNTIKTICLSDYCPDGEADDLLRRLRRIKPDGGALYINEARELFAPVNRDTGYERCYIGHLGRHPWFPEPV